LDPQATLWSKLDGAPFTTYLLVLTSLFVLGGIGLGSLWLWLVRYELLFLRDERKALHTTRNLFGSYYQVTDEFLLSARPELCLWVASVKAVSFLHPVLIDEQGEVHALSFDTVRLQPGAESAERYLRALSGVLG